jgi:DNA-binding MarR family transcriptional regulator
MTRSKLILGDFLPYQLSITSNAVSDLIARSYHGRFGIKIPEWRVMAVLGERGSATQRALVAATAMDKVTVNRASKALVDRGLIGRAPNETDGRSHHLVLTTVGQELYEQIAPLALSVESEIEGILGREEAQQLTDILAKLRSRVSEIERNQS